MFETSGSIGGWEAKYVKGTIIHISRCCYPIIRGRLRLIFAKLAIMNCNACPFERYCSLETFAMLKITLLVNKAVHIRNALSG